MNMQQPNCIILDLRPPVQRFIGQVWPDAGYMEYVYCILQTLINYCIQEHQMAEYEVREYAAQIELHEFDNDDCNMRIPPQHAPYVLELGMAILQQVVSLNIHDEEGELQYEYRPEEHPQFHEIILQKIIP